MSKAETVRKTYLGKTELRLVKSEGRFFGLADGKNIVDGDVADEVWRRLHDDAGKSNPKYFGFSGAKARFLHWFKGGFDSPNYASSERDYKVAAKGKLDIAAPVEKAATEAGFGEAALAAFRNTNLLSPYEKTRLQPLLRGPDADRFVAAAARFALGEAKSALADMDRVLKPYGSAKWTVATYLPYLWRPHTHMFLKPEVTKDFAARVGHQFANAYESRLTYSVYESLLDLVAVTEREVVDLRPRDRIDIQSFIWIVGDYKEGRESAEA